MTTRHTQKTNGNVDKDISEVLNDISPGSTDDDEDVNINYVLTEQERNLKDITTYYLFYKELDKKFNICISKLKPKEYFACILCDVDKDFIMEFENHFKYNVDYIKLPTSRKYSTYRTHNLTKDKLKQEMDKFINKLGVGYYLDYFSTVKNWTSKD